MENESTTAFFEESEELVSSYPKAIYIINIYIYAYIPLKIPSELAEKRCDRVGMYRISVLSPRSWTWAHNDMFAAHLHTPSAARTLGLLKSEG